MLKLYFRLAAINIKKNARMYLPYIISSTMTIMMFYILVFLSGNTGLAEVRGGKNLGILLILGCIVLGIFASVLLFYTNSFLTKRRKKEIGLYNILGFEKKHISRMMAAETLMIALLCIVAGLLTGILFSKLMLLLLGYILKASVGFAFYVSTNALVITAVLFFCIFFLNLLSNLRQIRLAKPIELLSGSNVGEKEPKARWLLALLGVLCLGAGYTIALVVNNPMKALALFFLAVLLVIAGTYLLFTAGSIAFLKLLRRNKNYYYKTKHFISVSGMLYRMKQNAVGLANICILCTMVLVMLSGTLSLNMGIEGLVRSAYPRNVEIEHYAYPGETQTVAKETREILAQQGVNPERFVAFRYWHTSLTCLNQDTSLSTLVLTAQEYAIASGKQVVLEDHQVLFSHMQENIPQIKDMAIVGEVEAGAIPQLADKETACMVVRDIAALEALFAKKDTLADQTLYIGFDMQGTEDQLIQITAVLEETLNQGLHTDTDDRYNVYNDVSYRSEYYTLNGGLLFLGIFLGVQFIMATVLIIYYKQLSEGYDDRKRFSILQKVGMSRREVSSVIHSQVLTVFFLPLVVAVMHVAFAFGIITQLLALLELTDVTLFLVCTLATIGVFSLLYTAVYLLTTRVYIREHAF